MSCEVKPSSRSQDEKAFMARTSPRLCIRRGRLIACDYDITLPDVLEARHIVVATGAKPAELKIPGAEHLATSDRGIAMQRRMLEQDIRKVMEGGDPAGVRFDEDGALIHVPSGNFYRKPAAA